MARFSFLIFVVLACAGLAMAVQCALDPLGFFVATRSASGIGRWIGTVLLGSNGITLVLAVTACSSSTSCWAARRS
jgi:hypothetical protein